MNQGISHLAIIMDGNGRWAERRGRSRVFGHIRGARVARKVTEHCSRLKLSHLTLYAFSTENWMRPKQEVSFLMNLLARHLRRERDTLIRNRIRFNVIGDIDRLPAPVRQEVLTTLAATKHLDGMVLTFALSYGGRADIAQAVRTIAERVKAGEVDPSDVDESLVSQHLMTAGMPDPDLILRTSGESRFSNFLLWQGAYSEFVVCPELWPDFTTQHLDQVFVDYGGRERRFGLTSAQIQQPAFGVGQP